MRISLWREIKRERNQKKAGHTYGWIFSTIGRKCNPYFLMSKSVEERMKNVADGKYILKTAWTKPKRDSRGAVIIENRDLYNHDLKRYLRSTEAWKISYFRDMGKYNHYDRPMYYRGGGEVIIIKDEAFDKIVRAFDYGKLDISHKTLSRIRADQVVSKATPEKICEALKCDIHDVIEYVREDAEKVIFETTDSYENE